MRRNPEDRWPRVIGHSVTLVVSLLLWWWIIDSVLWYIDKL